MPEPRRKTARQVFDDLAKCIRTRNPSYKLVLKPPRERGGRYWLYEAYWRHRVA